MDLQERINELEAELRQIKENPRYQSYLSALSQLMFWDKEITDKQVSIYDVKDKESASPFDNVLKYQLARTKLLEALDQDRKLLTPEQQGEAVKEATNILEKALQLNGKIQ